MENPRGGRKALKQLLLREIPEIEFHAPKRVNESERVSIKRTRDQAIQMAEDQTANIDADMKTLFDAAAIIRKSITKCRKWKFTGSLKNLPDENVPAELFSFVFIDRLYKAQNMSFLLERNLRKCTIVQWLYPRPQCRCV